MKAGFTLGLFVLLTLITVSCFAQGFTLTTTNANITSSRASVDMPGLTGNPLAIIVATPIGNTAMLNTHPIGAWYYSGKWNIFNTDHAVMPVGAKYKVQFFLQPGPNQFMHLVTKENLGAEGSYIDNPALNNNPGAQLQILQNFAPEVRSPYYLNRFEAKAGYSSAAGRWYIANLNGEPIGRGTVYNIVIGAAVANTGPTGPQIPKNPEEIAKPRDSTKVAVPSQPNVIQPVQPVTNVNLQATPGPAAPVPATPANTTPKLFGFVDMHTHPVSQLGFGEQLFFGDNDGDPNVALGSCSCFHNFVVPPFAGSCGQQNLYRNQMVDSIDDANHIAPRHMKVARLPQFRSVA